jgi:hypothetical protein
LHIRGVIAEYAAAKFSDFSDGEGSESERLVKKAAGLLRQKVEKYAIRRKFYPTA